MPTNEKKFQIEGALTQDIAYGDIPGFIDQSIPFPSFATEKNKVNVTKTGKGGLQARIRTGTAASGAAIYEYQPVVITAPETDPDIQEINRFGKNTYCFIDQSRLKPGEPIPVLTREQEAQQKKERIHAQVALVRTMLQAVKADVVVNFNGTTQWNGLKSLKALGLPYTTSYEYNTDTKQWNPKYQIKIPYGQLPPPEADFWQHDLSLNGLSFQLDGPEHALSSSVKALADDAEVAASYLRRGKEFRYDYRTRFYKLPDGRTVFLDNPHAGSKITGPVTGHLVDIETGDIVMDIPGTARTCWSSNDIGYYHSDDGDSSIEFTFPIPEGLNLTVAPLDEVYPSISPELSLANTAVAIARLVGNKTYDSLIIKKLEEEYEDIRLMGGIAAGKPRPLAEVVKPGLEVMRKFVRARTIARWKAAGISQEYRDAQDLMEMHQNWLETYTAKEGDRPFVRYEVEHNRLIPTLDPEAEFFYATDDYIEKTVTVGKEEKTVRYPIQATHKETGKKAVFLCTPDHATGAMNIRFSLAADSGQQFLLDFECPLEDDHRAEVFAGESIGVFQLEARYTAKTHTVAYDPKDELTLAWDPLFKRWKRGKAPVDPAFRWTSRQGAETELNSAVAQIQNLRVVSYDRYKELTREAEVKRAAIYARQQAEAEVAKQAQMAAMKEDQQTETPAPRDILQRTFTGYPNLEQDALWLASIPPAELEAELAKVTDPQHLQHIREAVRRTSSNPPQGSFNRLRQVRATLSLRSLMDEPTLAGRLTEPTLRQVFSDELTAQIMMFGGNGRRYPTPDEINELRNHVLRSPAFLTEETAIARKKEAEHVTAQNTETVALLIETTPEDVYLNAGIPTERIPEVRERIRAKLEALDLSQPGILPNTLDDLILEEALG